MADHTVHLMIAGRVQGVGYRAWVEREAARLGLSGWIRNKKSGEVEAAFAGPEDAVEEMVALTAAGPELADVHEVRVLGSGAPVPLGFTVLASE